MKLQERSRRLSWSSTTSSTGSSYVLAPAYDFVEKSVGQSSSYFMRYPGEDVATSRRALTPSSSRSSLSSTASDYQPNASAGMSQQTRSELDSFFNSFSRAKAAKRRSSLRWSSHLNALPDQQSRQLDPVRFHITCIGVHLDSTDVRDFRRSDHSRDAARYLIGCRIKSIREWPM